MNDRKEKLFVNATKRAFDGGTVRNLPKTKKTVEYVDPSRIYLMRVPAESEVEKLLVKNIELGNPKTHNEIKTKWKYNTGARFDSKMLFSLIDILKKAEETEVEFYLSKTDFPMAIRGANTGIELFIAPRISEENGVDPKKVKL